MRWLLLPLVLLAACEKGPEADLPSISEARSLGAEWALVNDQAAKGRLTSTYTRIMRRQVRKQLELAGRSLKQPGKPYGAEIRFLLAQPDDAPPKVLRAHSDRLKQIEDALESD